MPGRMLMHISSEESRIDPDSGTEVTLSAPVKLWALTHTTYSEGFHCHCIGFLNIEVFLL